MKISQRAFIVLAAIVIVVAIAAVVFVPRWLTPAVDANALATTAVRRGTLIATVSATGAISPLREAQLAFSATGPMTVLNVKQGDLVKAGQTLAALDTRSLDLQLQQAEANLVSAQAKLDQLKTPVQADVTAAQASLASAEAALAQLKTPNPNDVLIAKSDLDKAQAALAQAQASYDRAGGASNPYAGMLPTTLQLQQASLDYQKALAAYNAKFSPTDSQLKQAQSAVEQAKSQLARLTNPNVNDLKSAQANVDQLRAARDLAKTRLDDAVIRAPFDGIVTHVDLDLGSFTAAGRTIIGVADISEFRIKLNIDETDIASIKLGQEVTLNLDAYPDLNFNAQVAEVASTATTIQGVVNYVVSVALKPDQVPAKIGMTANANIVISKKDNVLLVPNQAIRASNSKRYVTIQTAPGKTQEVEVTLGSANDQETEIVSGLSEGQQVVTSITQLNPMTSGGLGAPKQ